MNQQAHFEDLKLKLQDLITTLQGGLPVSGNLLTDIKGDLDILKDCVETQKLHVEPSINGFTFSNAAGDTDLGTPRICIANNDVLLSSINTNIANLNSNLSNINTNIVPAYDPGNGRIQVDQQTLNGYDYDAGAGNLSAGTQRICIASDDNLTGTIAIQTGRVAGCVDLANNLLNVDNSMISGTVISVNSGNIDAGTQRVVIATDDTNLSNLSGILGDVWDPINHYLKVHIIP